MDVLKETLQFVLLFRKHGKLAYIELNATLSNIALQYIQGNLFSLNLTHTFQNVRIYTTKLKLA